MNYPIKVVDIKDRTVRIETEAASSKSTEAVIFRNRSEQFPVVRLPITHLLYRTTNGRTEMKQQEYVRRNKKPADYFVTGEENEEVQLAQHQILLELANDPRGDIAAELAHKRVQTEKLLVTHTGVVVNGNRRLAAMRDLLSEVDSFANVDVVVLPSTATIPDIEEIEADLQEIPETKLEYDWISRRLKLRRRRDVLLIALDTLRKWYRFRSQKEISKEIGQLELAEDYLSRYLGKPKEYELVEKSEQIFKQLQAALENKSGELEEMSRSIAYPLIKEARDLDDRVYQFRTAFGGDAEEVLKRFAAEKGIELTEESVEPANTEESDDDPLAGITDEPTRRYENIKPILMDGANSKDVARDIAKIATTIEQEKREGGRKLFALKRAQDANTLLHEIDLEGADPATYAAIRAQLESCIARAAEVCAKLDGSKTEAKVSGA